MNKKQVMELTGEDTKDMGIDCRQYPDEKLVLCVCCKNVVMTVDAKPTHEGDWACDRCWENARDIWEAMKYDRDENGGKELDN